MRHRAFTVTDLLVAVASMTLIAAVLLPAASFARGGSRSATSMDNLRTLSAAHFVYALDWNGRQITYVVDNASTYGDYGNWWREYNEEHGSGGGWGDPGNHPPIILGWGELSNGDYRHLRYEVSQPANAGLVFPINWEAPGTIGIEYFGSFRFPNAAQFNQYLDGRFYDHVFYAPADEVVIDAIGAGFDEPVEYYFHVDVQAPGSVPAWSSYCNSPAAMVDPEVMGHDDPDLPDDGWKDPFELPFGWRSPSVSQITYPNLKTHILEHHWLQNALFDNCNPGFDPGTYGDGCEPYYFNHGFASVPMTLFYDGHVEGVAVTRAIADDATVREMTGSDDWGLWSKDTPWAEDGYLSEYGYDQAQTSFHILTTDGAEGRDVLAEGVSSSTQRPRRGPDRVKRRAGPVRPGPRGACNAAQPCMTEN